MATQLADAEVSKPQIAVPDSTCTKTSGCQPTATTVRAVFISDTHLGCTYAQVDVLCHFLSELRPDFIYLVGDFIDGWELRRRFTWCSDSTRVVRMLLDLTRQGTRVRYAVGNHDDFLRGDSLLSELVMTGGFEIAEEFEHVTGDQRRFLVVHGDRFDEYEKQSPLFCWITSAFYNLMLAGNWRLSRYCGGSRDKVSKRLKSWFGSISRHVATFRSLLSGYARDRGYDGVICGHVHAPEQTTVNGFEYCNTGDWLENCSAIMEHTDGTLSLRFADCPPDYKAS